jgi:hypothetical protein
MWGSFGWDKNILRAKNTGILSGHDVFLVLARRKTFQTLS